MTRLRVVAEESARTARAYTSNPGSRLPEAWCGQLAGQLLKLVEVVEASAGRELHDPPRHAQWLASRDLHGQEQEAAVSPPDPGETAEPQ